MNTRAVAWFAIVLTALALVPAGAHLFSLASQIDLAEQEYFVAQTAYRGWGWFAAVSIAALVVNTVWAFRSRGQGSVFYLVTAAALWLGASVAIFFFWIIPVDQATGDWTVSSEDWAQLRSQWELAHAANAVITFAAFCCTVSAGLLQRP